MMKWLSKFRIFNRKKTAAEKNSTEGVELGYTISFCNKELGLDLFGAPKEIVDEFRQLGLDINEVAQANTRIVAYGVKQSKPNLEWHGGPQTENLMRLLDTLAARDFKAAESIFREDPKVLAKDCDGASIPLIAYAAQGDLEVVDFLLSLTASPNLLGEFDLSPLHWAAAGGHADVAASLLSSGADPIALGWFFLTPAEVASINGHDSLAATIKQSSPEFYDPDLWMNFIKRMGITK